MKQRHVHSCTPQHMHDTCMYTCTFLLAAVSINTHPTSHHLKLYIVHTHVHIHTPYTPCPLPQIRAAAAVIVLAQRVTGAFLDQHQLFQREMLAGRAALEALCAVPLGGGGGAGDAGDVAVGACSGGAV